MIAAVSNQRQHWRDAILSSGPTIANCWESIFHFARIIWYSYVYTQSKDNGIVQFIQFGIYCLQQRKSEMTEVIMVKGGSYVGADEAWALPFFSEVLLNSMK